jgi:superfamily I DNA/RNA helicase
MIQSNVGQSIAVLARTNEELNIVEAALKNDYGIDINRLNSKSIWENDNLKIIMHFCCTITQTNSHNHLVPLLVYLNESQENIVNINESLNGVSFGHCNVHDWNLNEYTIKLNHFCQQYWHLSNCTEDNQIASFIENMIGEFTPILSDGIKKFKETFITILLGIQENSLQDKLKRIDELTNQTSKKKVENDLPILTTFHGAKGLEWDIVWLMGLDEENIPHAMPGVILTKDVVEEERRLIYVGMTRAKSNLYLSWVKSPSEFLIEAFGLETLM